MKKRLLAALLTCVMLFSMLPATAFAEETPDAELEVTAVGAPSAEEGHENSSRSNDWWQG